MGGAAFEPVSNDMEVMNTLLDGNPADALQPRAAVHSLRARSSVRTVITKYHLKTLLVSTRRSEKAGLTPATLFTECQASSGKNFDIGDVMNELRTNGRKRYPRFWRRIQPINVKSSSTLWFELWYGPTRPQIFTCQSWWPSWSLMTRLGVEEAEYGEKVWGS